jgi:hypothetical protein
MTPPILVVKGVADKTGLRRQIEQIEVTEEVGMAAVDVGDVDAPVAAVVFAAAVAEPEPGDQTVLLVDLSTPWIACVVPTASSPPSDDF